MKKRDSEAGQVEALLCGIHTWSIYSRSIHEYVELLHDRPGSGTYNDGTYSGYREI
jgi:hypothetical protein